jgi:hypothetical protein
MTSRTTIAIATGSVLVLVGFAAAQRQRQRGANLVQQWVLSDTGCDRLADMKERRMDIFTTFDANEDDIPDAENQAAILNISNERHAHVGL